MQRMIAKTRPSFVAGARKFDSLTKSARSLTVPDKYAKKGRKNRDPLWCPEQDPARGGRDFDSIVDAIESQLFPFLQ